LYAICSRPLETSTNAFSPFGNLNAWLFAILSRVQP
jgi:hypothetical protein